jgi:hypothetical protein
MYTHPSQSLYPVGPSGPDADTFCRNEEGASPSLRSTEPLGVPTIKDKITSIPLTLATSVPHGCGFIKLEGTLPQRIKPGVILQKKPRR